MAAHHRVLMIGDESVILYTPQEKMKGAGSSIGREAAVSWAAPDFALQLQRALGNRDGDVVLLFNEADQTYRKEENILAADRQRRLETAFPNLIGRASLEIFSRPEDRGPDPAMHSYLLVGLPESENLRRLSAALSGARVSVEGFGLLPVESTGLVEVLAEKVFLAPSASEKNAPSDVRKCRWSMLSGQHETGGLRQVIVKDGNLALTRLVPVPGIEQAGAAAWAEAVMAEIRATMVYVRRFGYTDEQGLNAMVLCGEAEKPLFTARTVDGVNLCCLSLAEAFRHLGSGVTGQEGNNFADALHAAWTERKDALKLDIPSPLVTGESRARH